MKKATRIVWGIVLVAAGVLFALNGLGVTHVDVFFDGWWTLFILIPCTIGLFTERDKTGNLIGIILGVVLLLCSQDVLEFSVLWKLVFPVAVVLIGLKLVFGSFRKKESVPVVDGGQKTVCAIFSGGELNAAGEVFEGAKLTAVFGGIDCDLRQAIIEKDCTVEAVAVFGGVDILVPPHVQVKVKSVSVFGGVDNETASATDGPTVYITGVCAFGGVDIK